MTAARWRRIGPPALLILAIVLSAATSAAQARTFPERADASREVYYECAEESGGYNWAHAWCALKYLEREYAILDEQLQTILPTLNTRRKARLERSQRQWEARADRKCDAESGYIGEKYPGTMQIVDYKSCKGFEASLRIEWLEQRYGQALYGQAEGR